MFYISFSNVLQSYNFLSISPIKMFDLLLRLYYFKQIPSLFRIDKVMFHTFKPPFHTLNAV